MRCILRALLASLVIWSTGSGAEERYREPPAAIREVLDATPAASHAFSADSKYLLSVRYELYPPIAELAAPMHRLAGVRVNPRNNAPHAMPRFPCTLALRALPKGVEKQIKTRPGLRCARLDWSPDGRHFAFLGIEETGVHLWIGDALDASVREVPDLRLNPVLMHPLAWMPDGRSLLVGSVPAEREPVPVAAAPLGPEVRDSTRVTKPSSTYEERDLLETPHDADLFEYYGSTQLRVLDLGSLQSQPVGPVSVVGNLQVSPDGAYLLVTRINRPYAFSRSWNRFPRSIEIWTADGVLVETVADKPLADQVPIHGVETGPRSVNFIPTQAHTLWWVEALDQGDWAVKVAKRDRVVRKQIGQPAQSWFELDQRLSNLGFIEGGDTALVTEWERDRRWTRSFLVDTGAQPPKPRLLWDRSFNDSYADPGYPLYRPLPGNHYVIRRDGKRIWLSGDGATTLGKRPFLDVLDLTTLESTRLFRATPTMLESFRAWDDPVRGTFYSMRESPRDPRNLMHVTLGKTVRNAAAGEATRTAERTQITRELDPAPQLRGIKKQLVSFKRKDGVQLAMTVYLPPGHKAGTRVPTLLWAYPLEYSDAATAGQVNAAPNAFVVPYGAAFELLPLAGYAVIDVAMPIVGPTETVYESFVEQIVDNAAATIDEAVRMGFADRDRIGVFGHSHGALMTSNLLIWSDLFRAGVARSGAYNHTLRPFGFQTEHRTLYQARDTYLKLSPTLNADKVDEPLLLIHGAIDANPGTVPLQSEKLFEAVRGVGGTTRLVMLPFESHGYQGRESVGHVLAETIDWFDRYVKNAELNK